MPSSHAQTYSRTVSALHWGAAILLLLAFGLGLATANTTDIALKFTLYKVHAGLGTLIALTMLVRIVMMLVHARPAPDPEWPNWMIWSSKAVHLALIALPLLLVASGMGMSALTPLGQMALSGDISSWPVTDDLPPRLGHFGISRIFAAAFILHVAAALYHEFWRRDHLFARIWPWGERATGSPGQTTN